MSASKRINELQKLMIKHGIDAYIVASSDYHSSEYVGDYFKAREYMSGFTGSAGTLVVLKNEAYLWTDGRYFIQAEAQLKDSSIKLMKMGVENTPSIQEFLAQVIEDGSTIGFDGRTISNYFVMKLEMEMGEKSFNISWQNDLVGEIWSDRPELSKKPVWELDLKYCGMSVDEKLCAIRGQMDTKYLVVTALDEIAWTLNLRGGDVDCTPVFLSYLVIGKNDAILCVNKEIISKEIEEKLNANNIVLADYDKFYKLLSMLEGSVQLDSATANYCVLKSINSNEIIDTQSPIELMKAIKNETEIANIKNAHIKDGVAITKFIYWLKNNVNNGDITELDAVKMIDSLRAEQDDFVDISFDSIIAYREHGAIVHYEPTNQTNIRLEPYSLCLADTGGHYLDGTTDITRTIALGELTEEERHDYTLVLKGNLNLANAVFKYGCTGENLDQLACAPLWREGLDFNHSTGHGVGYLLSVHEGPQKIYWDTNRGNNVVLEEGMIISNEPGLYIENKFGIRLENLVLVKEHTQSEYGKFLCFETLTLAPFDLSVIDKSLLTDEEKFLLNEYHKRVYEQISPYLNEDEKSWLRLETREI